MGYPSPLRPFREDFLGRRSASAFGVNGNDVMATSAKSGCGLRRAAISAPKTSALLISDETPRISKWNGASLGGIVVPQLWNDAIMSGIDRPPHEVAPIAA